MIRHLRMFVVEIVLGMMLLVGRMGAVAFKGNHPVLAVPFDLLASASEVIICLDFIWWFISAEPYIKRAAWVGRSYDLKAFSVKIPPKKTSFKKDRPVEGAVEPCGCGESNALRTFLEAAVEYNDATDPCLYVQCDCLFCQSRVLLEFLKKKRRDCSS
jgi:hypothetical protein